MYIDSNSKGGDVMDAKVIAERLRDLRGNLPRKTVSEAVGISVSALSMYENRARVPRDITKVALAKFYGKSVEAIFFNK